MTLDVLTAVITYAIFQGATYYKEPPSVNWTALSTQAWWGPSSEQDYQDTEIHSKSISFDDDMISDLRRRLNNSRAYVPPLEGANFTYGFNSDEISAWASYWMNDYDFSAAEALFNQFPMYVTNIQGMDIAFYKISPQVNDSSIEVVPLLMLHGFPSSVRDFFGVIPLLSEVSSNRDYAIELIVPYMPGFGWSEGAVRAGLGAGQMAVVMKNLMQRLGYTKYYVHGGIFGEYIASNMATLFPEEVLGYHTTRSVVLTPFAVLVQMLGSLYPPLVVSEELASRMYPLYDVFSRIMSNVGYMHEVSTKPDTVSVGLQNSPIALLSFMLDTYASRNLVDGGLSENYDKDYLIDVLMQVWATGSIDTSARLYAESFSWTQFELRLYEIPCTVPTWVVVTPNEPSYQPPSILALKYKNLVDVTVLDEGGRWWASEKPDVFAETVFSAITTFRAIAAAA